MPATTGIIDTLATPPLASLQQVLDTAGPYTAGNHTLTTFTTDGAFLLPAGTYDIGGVYGVIVTTTTFAPDMGIVFGWNDVSEPVISGDTYRDRLAQVCLVHTLPITGAHTITAVFDIYMQAQLCLWPVYIGSAGRVGLHVFPNLAVDLYYLCVL